MPDINMLDINGLEVIEGRLGKLLCEVVSADPAQGVRVRILNSEFELLVGCKPDEVFGGPVADSEFAMLEDPKLVPPPGGSGGGFVSENVSIPKIDYDDSVGPGCGPGWVATLDTDRKPQKPVIRCNCGKYSGIALHHVHADGRVTASFHHAAAHELQKVGDNYFFTHKGKQYQTEPGCGWHVFLTLLDYAGGEFPPEP